MHKNDDENYDRQTELLEKFLSKNDRAAFQKILNMNITSSSEKEKMSGRFRNKSHLLKSMKTKHPSLYYDNFHMNNNIQPNYNLNVNNTELYNFNYNNNFKENQISSFKLDFHNILQDPEYKDKCMRGNYKWANLKFQQMKVNLAKRKGIPVEDLKMPKIWTNKKQFKMEMNGNEIKMSNNNEYNTFRKNYTTSTKETSKSNYIYNKYNKFFKTKKNLKAINNKIPSPKAGKTMNIFNHNNSN